MSIYPEGIDFAWIATDQNNCVGAFITGGEGPIPLSLLNNRDDDIFDIENKLLELPKTSQKKCLSR